MTRLQGLARIIFIKFHDPFLHKVETYKSSTILSLDFQPTLKHNKKKTFGLIDISNIFFCLLIFGNSKFWRPCSICLYPRHGPRHGNSEIGANVRSNMCYFYLFKAFD